MANTDVAPSSRTGARRGPYAKTANTRRVIIDAALEVFATSGYRSGSLREIAERVGMSEAGLLHHFPSKSALLAAVLERRDEHSLATFVPPDEPTGVSMLTGIVRLAEYNAAVPGVVRLFTTLSAEATDPDHPAHTYFVERYDMIRRITRTAFARLRDRGALRPGVDPDNAAVSVIAVMDGLQVQWLLGPTSVDMAAEMRRHLERLVTIDF